MEHDDQNSPRPFTPAFPSDNSFDGISFDAAGTYQGDSSASPTTMTQPPVLSSPTPQTPVVQQSAPYQPTSQTFTSQMPVAQAPKTSPPQPLTPQASPTVSAQQSPMTQMPIIPIIAPYQQSAAQQPPVQQTPLVPASQRPLQSSTSSAQQRIQPTSPANPQSPADPHAGHARQARQPLPPIPPYKGRKATWYWEKAPDDNYTNPQLSQDIRLVVLRAHPAGHCSDISSDVCPVSRILLRHADDFPRPQHPGNLLLAVARSHHRRPRLPVFPPRPDQHPHRRTDMSSGRHARTPSVESDVLA